MIAHTVRVVAAVARFWRPALSLASMSATATTVTAFLTLLARWAIAHLSAARSKLVQVYAGAGIAKTAHLNSKALDAAFPLRTLDTATLARQSRNMN